MGERTKIKSVTKDVSFRLQFLLIYFEITEI